MKTRWVVLTTQWYECIAAAMPFLVPGQSWTYIDPAAYAGPNEGEQDVVMAPHRAPQLAPVFAAFPDRITLYETENMLDPASPWVAPSTRLRLACPENRWLNYSRANASMFGDGVHPLRKIHHLPARDNREPRPIDVLFVGSLNHRRATVLAKLARAGAKVHAPAGAVFGAELARLEARSKIMLNVHYYTPGVFESFRVVPAAHRGTPVISETSAMNEGAEWAPCYSYADLVEATLSALKRT
jgi:hypothetical protein